jgi:hypothetical protein
MCLIVFSPALLIYPSQGTRKFLKVILAPIIVALPVSLFTVAVQVEFSPGFYFWVVVLLVGMLALSGIARRMGHFVVTPAVKIYFSQSAGSFF